MEPLIGTSDWHLGGGDTADDADESGIRWVVDTALSLYQPSALVCLGDVYELWQFSMAEILRAHAPLLTWIDGRCLAAGVPLLFLPGNHDATLGEHLDALHLVMPHASYVTTDHPVLLHGWRMSHGQEWDALNHGPFSVVAHGFTLFARGLETIGLNESWLDPTRLTSPARAKRASLQTRIREAADAYVDAHHDERVICGHTHRRRIRWDRRLVNCGCNTQGHGEFAAAFEDGNAVLHERDS